jgi:hypothetical protein
MARMYQVPPCLTCLRKMGDSSDFPIDVPQGVKGVRENYFSKLSPVGTAEISPGRQSWGEGLEEMNQSRRDG